MEYDRGALTHHLPFLRRYARALAGNQKVADTIVLATVHSLAAINPFEDRSSSIREHLYARFTSLWNGPMGEHVKELARDFVIKPGVEKRLSAMPGLARQAFLLTKVEGFEDSQVRRILGVNAAQLARLLESAQISMIEQTKTKVMIIEDEMFIATDLEDIMLDLGHEVVAIERTHKAAIEALHEHKPGLILADIQLADGSSGIDAVNEIISYFPVPVIFITAYPERLLTGLRPEPAFVIPKPFNADMVKALATQALYFDTIAAPSGTPILDAYASLAATA